MRAVRDASFRSLAFRILSALAFLAALSLYLGDLRHEYISELIILCVVYGALALAGTALGRVRGVEGGSLFFLGAVDVSAAVAVIRLAPPALPLAPIMVAGIFVGHVAADRRPHTLYLYFLSAFLFLGGILLWRGRLPFTTLEVAGQALLFAVLWGFFGVTFYSLFNRRQAERREARRVKNLGALLSILHHRWVPARERLRDAARLIGSEVAGEPSGCRIVVHGEGHILPPTGDSTHEPLLADGLRVGTLILTRRGSGTEDNSYIETVKMALASFLSTERFWDGVEQRLDRFEAGLLLGDLKRAQTDAAYLEGLKPVLDFARGTREFRPERVHFTDILWAAVEKTRPLAERRQLILAVDEDGGTLSLTGDRPALVRLAGALLNAAGNAAPEGSGLRISGHVDGDTIVLSAQWPGHETPDMEADGAWESAYLRSALAEHGGRIWPQMSADSGSVSLNLSLRFQSSPEPTSSPT